MEEIGIKQAPEVTEIIEAEKKRAQKLMNDPLFTKWVTDFREKYIVKGFLTPMYAPGRNSRTIKRVDEFKNYIMRSEVYGTMFKEAYLGFIHAEEMWFWAYLAYGIDLTRSGIFIDQSTEDGEVPGSLMWLELAGVMKQMHLSQTYGGGMILSRRWLNDGYMSGTEEFQSWYEAGPLHVTSIQEPNPPNWINLFHIYESFATSGLYVEARPAWFHVINYAFFNTTIDRLPVCCGLLSTKGRMQLVRILDGSLSDRAGIAIIKDFFEMPAKLRKYLKTNSFERERRDMIWWLWKNVGNKYKGRILTYREIAGIEGAKRSTVSTAVERLNRQLKENINDAILGRLLTISASIGFSLNKTYKTMEKQGLVPAREREIDGFDDPDKLLSTLK